MPTAVARPAASEHLPYYARYIQLVSGNDALSSLKSQLRETLAFLSCLANEDTVYRYAPDKWSVREVLGHVIDTERIMAYRALRIARGDQTPLPGFEQDDYVRGASYDRIRWSSLVEEFELLRRSNLAMFSGFTEEAWARTGTASGATVTARALAWIVAGHELHHRNVIEQKYLKQR